MKKRTFSSILSSVLTIVLCVSLIAGSTFALFTSEDRVDISVTAGQVSIDAYLDNIKTYSMDTRMPDGSFENGGTAVYKDGTLTLDRLTPGDEVEFNVNIENNSNVYVKYSVKAVMEGELGEALLTFITFEGESEPTQIEGLGNVYATELCDLGEGVTVLPMSILLPEECGNEYQQTSATVTVTVEAIQGYHEAQKVEPPVVEPEEPVEPIDPFEVKSPEIDEAGVYHVSTPGQMLWLSDKVNTGEMDGKKLEIVIKNDIDFEGMQIIPMGTTSHTLRASIKGENENGEGITVSNFVINEPKGEGVGLFGFMNGSISGINIDGASVLGYHWTAGLVGYIYGNVTDCTVKNTDIVCKDTAFLGFFNGDKCGSLIGYLGDGKYKITNCHAENVSISANRDAAQLIGYAQTGTELIGCTATNVTVVWNGKLFYKDTVKPDQLTSNLGY